MKILIIQEASRHEEDRQFRECLALKRAFHKHGWSPTVWGLGHDNYDEKINFNSFDFIINLENYGDTWLPDLSEVKKPYKILWSIDAHVRGIDIFDYIFDKGKYNLMLQSTRSYCENRKNTIWFPNAYCNDVIKPLNIEKVEEIVFVGNYVNRIHLIQLMQEKFNLKPFIGVRGNNMVKVINESKIHFNKNILNDLNYRNFETIGCGTLLLTDYNDQYSYLGFQDMKNVVFYKTIEELMEKTRFLLDNQKEIDTIAKSGFDLAGRHSYFKRVEQLIKFLKQI